jgi:carbon storage regulator
MLVLTRRREETIVIGGDIEVVVLHVGHEGVKLGVRAPKDVPVHRGEIFEQVAAQNRVAATGNRPDEKLLAALRRGRKNATAGVVATEAFGTDPDLERGVAVAAATKSGKKRKSAVPAEK